MLRNVTRELGIDTSYFVWAHRSELMGRYIYELGRTPRRATAWYQRKFSAASKLGIGMVDWSTALNNAELFHTSGITFSLATYSGYERNHNQDAFEEALSVKPDDCKVGVDFNYRGSLWGIEECKQVMTPIIQQHVDWFITTIEDMARIYGMSCGQYSAEAVNKGDVGQIRDADLKAFAEHIQDTFQVSVVGITVRYPDSFEQHRWESAALDGDGNFFRSPSIRPIVLGDRIGGGDTWNSGFYYGLLTESNTADGIVKGVMVGDAITRLKQTLMFDLGIITKEEVQALMDADETGEGKRTAR